MIIPKHTYGYLVDLPDEVLLGNFAESWNIDILYICAKPTRFGFKTLFPTKLYHNRGKPLDYRSFIQRASPRTFMTAIYYRPIALSAGISDVEV